MENLIMASKAVFSACSNPLRSHLALDGMTLARAADIELPLDRGRADLVKTETRNRTAKET